jgi:hypothetical protein
MFRKEKEFFHFFCLNLIKKIKNKFNEQREDVIYYRNKIKLFLLIF